jgi:hypothetical protein
MLYGYSTRRAFTGYAVLHGFEVQQGDVGINLTHHMANLGLEPFHAAVIFQDRTFDVVRSVVNVHHGIVAMHTLGERWPRRLVSKQLSPHVAYWLSSVHIRRATRRQDRSRYRIGLLEQKRDQLSQYNLQLQAK